MPKLVKPLSAKQVEQAKPKAAEYSLSDGGGLALRVTPNGRKRWLLNYLRPFSKKRNNLALGHYPELGLAGARQKREEAKELLTQDIDPQEHRDNAALRELDAASSTLEAVSASWLQVKRSQVSDDHANDIWRSLELHIFPALGKRPIGKLLARHAIKELEPIAAKGSLETVRRLSQRLNEIMVFAVNTGEIESNPLAGIGKAFQTPKKQHMPTLEPVQLPDLMRALSYASIKITTRCLIEWQLHTMVRPSEAAGARWEEIDIDNALWVIPASRMKKKKAHTVPLSPQTLALLSRMEPISRHREHVFVSDRDPLKHANPQTANMALKRMGYGGVLVAHGMRSLASTTLNEQGFDADVIEAALAHADKDSVRSAYNRAEYLERRKVMMHWWSNFIEGPAIGRPTISTNANLLQFVSR